VLLYVRMLFLWSRLAMPVFLGSDGETHPPFYFDQNMSLRLPNFHKFRLLAIGPSKLTVVIRICTRSLTWPRCGVDHAPPPPPPNRMNVIYLYLYCLSTVFYFYSNDIPIIAVRQGKCTFTLLPCLT
jgi:hypothetical protein